MSSSIYLSFKKLKFCYGISMIIVWEQHNFYLIWKKLRSLSPPAYWSIIKNVPNYFLYL